MAEITFPDLGQDLEGVLLEWAALIRAGGGGARLKLGDSEIQVLEPGLLPQLVQALEAGADRVMRWKEAHKDCSVTREAVAWETGAVVREELLDQLLESADNLHLVNAYGGQVTPAEWPVLEDRFRRAAERIRSVEHEVQALRDALRRKEDQATAVVKPEEERVADDESRIQARIGAVMGALTREMDSFEGLHGTLATAHALLRQTGIRINALEFDLEEMEARRDEHETESEARGTIIGQLKEQIEGQTKTIDRLRRQNDGLQTSGATLQLAVRLELHRQEILAALREDGSEYPTIGSLHRAGLVDLAGHLALASKVLRGEEVPVRGQQTAEVGGQVYLNDNPPLTAPDYDPGPIRTERS